MAFCTNCGAEIQDGVSFCTKCGIPIADAPIIPAPSPQLKKRPQWIIPAVAAACAFVLGVGAYAVSSSFIKPIEATTTSSSSLAVGSTVDNQSANQALKEEEAAPEAAKSGGATADNVLGAFQERRYASEEEMSGGLDFEEAKQHGEYIMLKRGEKYYPIGESKVEYHEANYWDYVLRYADKDYVDIPTFDFSAGDELILFEKVGYWFWRVEDQDDCLWPVETSHYLSYLYDEIDDQEVSGNRELAHSILASKGAYFTNDYGSDEDWGWLHGPRGTSFRVGKYVGTSFEEDTITIDAEYWPWREAKKVDIEEIKTKDGYFVLDTSNFVSGTYLGTFNTGFSSPDFIFRIADSSGETVNQEDSNSAEASKPAAANAATASKAFYGIWVGAFKEKANAEERASELEQAGYSPEICYTPDWENLNSEPYYAVSAGVFETKDEAEGKLSAIKSQGYSDAYIKFTGNKR